MADFRVFALVLAAGVVVPGVADYSLAQAGYETVGAAVWALGYGTTILLLYAGWFRHLDIGATR